jgi:hypothetical protein
MEDYESTGVMQKMRKAHLRLPLRQETVGSAKALYNKVLQGKTTVPLSSNYCNILTYLILKMSDNELHAFINLPTCY